MRTGKTMTIVRRRELQAEGKMNLKVTESLPIDLAHRRRCICAAAAWFLGGLPVLAGAWPAPLVVQFPGSARFKSIQGERRFEALMIEVDVDLPRAGDYVVFGHLSREGVEIATSRPPSLPEHHRVHAVVSGVGRVAVTLRFSGEEINRAGLDGPYDLRLGVTGPGGASGVGSIRTPAFRYQQFGK